MSALSAYSTMPVRLLDAAVSLLLHSDREVADRILEVLRTSDYQALWLPRLRGELDERLMRKLLTNVVE